MVSLITRGTQSPSELLCLSLPHTHTHTHSHDEQTSTVELEPSASERKALTDLQLQRNPKHLVRKRRAEWRRHRRLTAWLDGGSQLLVIPGTETSQLSHISRHALWDGLLVKVADDGTVLRLENQAEI